jgi:putative tricarboxylic transport membrane protein
VSDTGTAASPKDRRLSGGLLIGLGYLALAAFVGTGALAIGLTPTYSRVGPGVFPAAVAAGLAAVGIALIVQALMGRWETDWDRADPRDAATRRRGRAALTWVAVGLVLDLLLLDAAGFVIASAAMFVCTAQAFGSSNLVRNTVLGLALGGAIFIVFAYALQVRLPAGWLWTLF